MIFTFSMFVSFLWIIGQAFRDKTLITALCFYIPSAYLFILLILASIIVFYKKQPFRGSVTLFLSMLPLYFVLGMENNFKRQSISPPTSKNIRLMHWNICRMKWTNNRKKTIKLIRSYNADIYLLTEVAGGSTAGDIESILGEGYRALRLGCMAIAGRGRIETGMWLANDDYMQVYPVTWNYRGYELKIFIVDIASSLLNPRRISHERLMKFIEKYKPDIIVGDFNSPRRSLVLDSLPDGYRHAYDAVGTGWSYTWPTLPFPAISIDQCITGPGIIPLSYSIIPNRHSDHCIQVLDFNPIHKKIHPGTG